MSQPALPQYHRIFLQLRERIIEGDLRPGDRVPGEIELAGRYGVSRITSKRALNELERAGLVSRERGRGTLVRHGRLDTLTLDGTLESLAASNRLIGQSSVRVLAFAPVTPPPAARHALRTAPGESVYMIARVRSAGGVPFCHVTAYVPDDIGRSLSREKLETTMLVDLIERTGAAIERAQQSVSATIAGPEVAADLGIDAGAPLLRVTHTAYAAGDRPVEHFTALFRPDRYRISMELSRRPASSSGEGSLFDIAAPSTLPED